MKRSICGADCEKCPSKNSCHGCAETNGCPFGKECFVARYILTGGMEAYESFKNKLIEEINALDIAGMDKVTELVPLVGRFVNLSYRLPSGERARFLKDDEMYLGAQVADLLDDTKTKHFGVIARESFIIVCEYATDLDNAELLVYKRR